MDFGITMESPLGPLALYSEGQHLTAIEIGQRVTGAEPHPLLTNVAEQIQEYFAGTRQVFDIPLRTTGTAFQESIWEALEEIPYGETLSYGQLGLAIGKPGSARAVGGAVGANPIPIVIPCHRVLASDRRLTGYSGGDGIPTKEKLLDLEQISYR